jgi:hypothetical protein
MLKKSGNEAFVTAQTFKTHFKGYHVHAKYHFENGREQRFHQLILIQQLIKSSLVMMC